MTIGGTTTLTTNGSGDTVRLEGDAGNAGPSQFVGAVTVATGDAADLIDMRYEPLPAVVDPERALDPGAPRVHATLDTNLAFEHRWSAGDVDAAFRRAAHVVSGRFVHARVAPVPMETRGCLARYEGGELTVWISTQMAHHVRGQLATVFGLPEHRIRVITPQVGGGFGCKCGLYDDEIVTVAAALRLGAWR